MVQMEWSGNGNVAVAVLRDCCPNKVGQRGSAHLF